MPDRLGNGGLHPRSTHGVTRHTVPLPGIRIQRSRKKGVQLPESARYVGRPTIWGNPFEHRHWGHAKATLHHDRWLHGQLGALSLESMGFSVAEIDALFRLRERVMTRLHSLAGCNLACWCPITSRWCHADNLLRMIPFHADCERWAA